MMAPSPFTNHCFTNQQPVAQWLPIPGFPKYKISNDGRVKSFKPSGEKILSPGYKGKYPYVLLSHNGKRKLRTIHSLVAEAFVGPAQGRKIQFKDGDRGNVTLSNLEYCETQGALMAAAVLRREREGKQTGRLRDIDHEWRVMLREAITQRIRALCQELKQVEVAERVGVSVSSISRIVSGERGYGGTARVA